MTVSKPIPDLIPQSPVLYDEIFGDAAPAPVVTLVGMAGSGKSTVGELLSRALGCALLDTDRLIEAMYGQELEPLYRALGREAFLQAESGIVAGLSLSRAVVSTGGSVIYSDAAMRHLAEKGPIIWLRAETRTVQARLDACGTRGLAIAPEQTLADLVEEREPLYAAAANHTILTDGLPPHAVAEASLAWLKERPRP